MKTPETEQEKQERIKLLAAKIDLIKSGYGGINSKGHVIDRREESGIPFQKNTMFDTPEPKEIEP